MNLGEKLKENLQKKRAFKQANPLEIKQVLEFYESTYNRFKSEIEEGNVPSEASLSLKSNSLISSILKTYNWPRSNIKLSEPSQTTTQYPGGDLCPFRILWENFKADCEKEGLQPFWSFKHDGAGIESWWTLAVQPKDNTKN